MSLRLSKRLDAVAQLVCSGKIVADIGTDHAYLPAYLVLCGKTPKAYCCDIGKGPLENAVKTIEKYDLVEKITPILSNGLEMVPGDAEEIVIAGMGGELICDILSRKPEIMREGTHLILQPMTHSQEVREFLCSNGFEIESEETVLDDKAYLIISAFYTGKIQKPDGFFCYFGKIRNESQSDKMYISRQLNYVLSKHKGCVYSGDNENAEYFADIIKKSEELL